MSTRNVHVWKTTNEDGEKREVRAERFANRWKFQSKLKHDERWTYHDVPPMEDLLELRDVLWRKYQRKRLPFSDVESIDRLIRERGGTVPEPSDDDGNEVEDSE